MCTPGCTSNASSSFGESSTFDESSTFGAAGPASDAALIFRFGESYTFDESSTFGAAGPASGAVLIRVCGGASDGVVTLPAAALSDEPICPG